MGNVDTNDKLWGLFGFFVPIGGLILYLVWRQERPMDAGYARKGMIGGFVFWGLLVVLRIVLFFWFFVPFFARF